MEGKQHVPVATDTNATTVKRLFSVWSDLRLYKANKREFSVS
jgi:hypothetical protein